MDYFIYFVLGLLLARSVDPSDTQVDSGKVERMFEAAKSHMKECPRRRPDSILLLALLAFGQSCWT